MAYAKPQQWKKKEVKGEEEGVDPGTWLGLIRAKKSQTSFKSFVVCHKALYLNSCYLLSISMVC